MKYLLLLTLIGCLNSPEDDPVICRDVAQPAKYCYNPYSSSKRVVCNLTYSSCTSHKTVGATEGYQLGTCDNMNLTKEVCN